MYNAMNNRGNLPAERLAEICSRIAAACERAGRDVGEVTLVAASKTVAPEQLGPFIEAGLINLGENYVQEGISKIEVLKAGVWWHLIGALQSNKAKQAVAHFDLIHSVDRVSLAQALNRAAGEAGKVQPILLQVNVGDESSKAGCSFEELPQLAQSCAAFTNLEVRGLMCLPPYNEDFEKTRPYFRALREARDRLQGEFGAHLCQLSMGMSNDFEIAIEEGATLVRVGTALFGDRVYDK